MKDKLYKIIFEYDTKAGKQFDIGLIILIFLSLIALILDSANLVSPSTFYIVELSLFTLFAVEYILRIYLSHGKFKYVTSFYGIIDFIAILPLLLEILIPGFKFLSIIRVIRVLRLFRIFKLTRYIKELEILSITIRNSVRKLIIFFILVSVIVVIMGSLMYVVEGGGGKFNSIPVSIYWAIVTITTVGYGDVIPQTVLGKIIASLLMLSGYTIIAVPTGIFSYELSKSYDDQKIKTNVEVGISKDQQEVLLTNNNEKEKLNNLIASLDDDSLKIILRNTIEEAVKRDVFTTKD